MEIRMNTKIEIFNGATTNKFIEDPPPRAHCRQLPSTRFHDSRILQRRKGSVRWPGISLHLLTLLTWVEDDLMHPTEPKYTQLKTQIAISLQYFPTTRRHWRSSEEAVNIGRNSHYDTGGHHLVYFVKIHKVHCFWRIMEFNHNYPASTVTLIVYCFRSYLIKASKLISVERGKRLDEMSGSKTEILMFSQGLVSNLSVCRGAYFVTSSARHPIYKVK